MSSTMLESPGEATRLQPSCAESTARPRPRPSLGGLPSTYWWLWFGWLVSALANFVFPFLAFFLTARGMSAPLVGLVVSLFGAGSVVAGPFAGYLADHLGRRPALLLVLLGSAGSAAALAFLTSLSAIGIAVFIFGLASQAVTAPFQAIVADVVPAEARPRAFDLAYWARNVGASLSLVAGGVLASVGWALPFLLDAATTLAFAFVVLRRIPETRPSTPPGGPSAPGYRQVLADRTLVMLLALHAVLATALWQLHAGLPVTLASRGTSPAAFGAVLAANTILVGLLQSFASRLTHAIAPTRLLALAALLVGAGLGGYALCSSPAHYAIATAVLTLGEIGYLPVVGALVADLAPPTLRGRYAGALGFSFGLAGLLAPILGSLLIQEVGATSLWGTCLVACVVVAAGFARLAGPSAQVPEHRRRA